MAAYIVATVTITDPVRFAEYGKAIVGLSEKFGGEAVVKGPVMDRPAGGGEPRSRCRGRPRLCPLRGISGGRQAA